MVKKWGIKISKKGQDISDEIVKIIKPQGESQTAHIQYILVLPYIVGAKKQVDRYQKVASTLGRTQLNGVLVCIHEVSCLFEDLSTIAIYSELYGKSNDLNDLWRDIRNHIRHDFREEFDDVNDNRKIERAKNLKLTPKLQADIGFTPDSIKIGTVTVEIQQIINYIKWAEDVMAKVLNEAKKKSYIK
ncbi:MAG: hypothetical protein WC437_01890 [Patescibacteria group bacterium]